MDTRAIILAVTLVLTSLIWHLDPVYAGTSQSPTDSSTSAAPKATSQVTQNSSSQMQKGSSAQTSPTSKIGGSSNQPRQHASPQTTKHVTQAPKPISCNVGSCDGTGVNECLNDTKGNGISPLLCKAGEKCAVLQTKVNGTNDNYEFSCEAKCDSLAGTGLAACCDTTNCIPEITTPNKNNNGGDVAVLGSVICFFGVVLSVFLM